MEPVLCPVTIGREQEMLRLERALGDVRGGSSSVVVLAGDAGLGKTRLAADLAGRASEAGMIVLWGACSEAELSLPYLPFLEAVGNQLALADLAALRRRLGSAHLELGRLFPQLGLEEPPPDPNDPTRGRLRLFESVLALLQLAAAPGGMLLVLENVHWADGASRELLEYLVRRLRGSPVMVLVTTRLERLHRRHPVLVMVEGWRRGRIAEVVELAPLPDEGVAAMLRATFDLETVPHEVSSILRDRSEGNPFALEEILKDALDRGGSPRAALSPEALGRLRLPRSVRDSVLERLEGLPDDAAEVLRCASVLGRSFDHALLMQLTGLTPQAVRAALRACVQQQLLEDDQQQGGFFRFRHALTREAVYEDLLAPQREELHAAAADALRERPATPDIELCRHLLAARREREAVPLAVAAAEQAMRTHAYREATSLYERVLPLVADQHERGELLCLAGRGFLLQGNAARGERHLRAGVRELERSGDSLAAAGHRIWLGRCYRERSRPDLAVAAYEAARERLEREGPSEELALAYVNLARHAVFQLDGRRAIDLARRAIDVAGRADAPRIEAYTYLGLGHIQLGELAEGLRHLDLAYGEAHDGGYDLIAAGALYNAILVLVQLLRPLEADERLRTLRTMEAGDVVHMQALRADGFTDLWGLGRPARARQAFEEALALAHEGEMQGYVNWLEIQLAVTLDELDRLEEAQALLARVVAREGQDRATALFAQMRISLDLGRVQPAVAAAGEVLAGEWPLRTLGYLGVVAVEAFVAAGRVPEARKLLRRMVTAGASADNPFVRRMRGTLALTTGAPDQAIEELRQVADLWRQAGARPWEARTRLALAGALAASGRAIEAQAELRDLLRSAQERESPLQARLAREALARLARRVVDSDHVRDALEALHQPAELGQAQLGRLLGLADDPGGLGLHRLLLDAVRRLAESSDGREREAGRLLLDYYVSRVGSQETVAERLHLTRATFYRRLHFGWELLAGRLASAT